MSEKDILSTVQKTGKLNGEIFEAFLCDGTKRKRALRNIIFNFDEAPAESVNAFIQGGETCFTETRSVDEKTYSRVYFAFYDDRFKTITKIYYKKQVILF